MVRFQSQPLRGIFWNRSWNKSSSWQLRRSRWLRSGFLIIKLEGISCLILYQIFKSSESNFKEQSNDQYLNRDSPFKTMRVLEALLFRKILTFFYSQNNEIALRRLLTHGIVPNLCGWYISTYSENILLVESYSHYKAQADQIQVWSLEGLWKLKSWTSFSDLFEIESNLVGSTWDKPLPDPQCY